MLESMPPCSPTSPSPACNRSSQSTGPVRIGTVQHQVTANFPPTFLVHAKNDPVKVENSLRLLDALAAAGIPASPQIFETGGHGFGLARKHPVLSAWPDQLLTWLSRLP